MFESILYISKKENCFKNVSTTIAVLGSYAVITAAAATLPPLLLLLLSRTLLTSKMPLSASYFLNTTLLTCTHILRKFCHLTT